MEQYIPKAALVAEIESLLDKGRYHEEYDCAYRDGNNGALYALKGKLNTLEVKEYETKSGTVQKDLQIVLDDGTYIDLDPSMQLKSSFSVKEGERVKVIISKED